MKKLKKIIQILKKYKTFAICIVIILLSIFSVCIQAIDRKNNMKVNSTKLEKKENEIAVYITGAVKNPGVYYLKIDSRLYELLDLCGGVNESADISKINLAQKLVDSDMITIPEKQMNSAEEDLELDEGDTKKVNINTASKEELMNLNGVGEQTANKIIEYRKVTRFNDIEDLLNVSGIGVSKYESIKDYICVD